MRPLPAADGSPIEAEALGDVSTVVHSQLTPTIHSVERSEAFTGRLIQHAKRRKRDEGVMANAHDEMTDRRAVVESRICPMSRSVRGSGAREDL
jgi:hypothetical protein